MWWPSDYLKFHGLFGRSFRAPTFNDLYWPREDWGIFGGVEGNVNIGPESATSYEIGSSLYLFESIFADVTYFRNEYDDLINWSRDNAGWYRPENTSSALTEGVDVNLDTVLLDRIKANLNYTFLTPKNTGTGNLLEYRSRHKAKAMLNFEIMEGFDITWDGKYISKRFTNATNTKHLGGYFVGNCNLRKKINDNADLLFSVDNMFDEEFEETEDYPMPKLTVMAGVKLKI